MIRIDDVSKSWRRGARTIDVLRHVKLNVHEGEFACLRGASGSGKTTLLLIAGGLLDPTAGEVEVDGRKWSDVHGTERDALRRSHIGFVFQTFHLIPYLDVLGNVLLGARHLEHADRMTSTKVRLEELGLMPRIHHRPAELSVGERQRVAVARALIGGPKIVLADEPTGNLDPENEAIVYEALGGFRDGGGTVLVVTHGEAAEEYADVVVDIDALQDQADEVVS